MVSTGRTLGGQPGQRRRSRYREEMEPVPSASEPVDFDTVIDDALPQRPDQLQELALSPDGRKIAFT